MNNFQYDSCIARGVCSVSPRAAALIVVLVVYLKIIIKYSERIFKETSVDKGIKELILNSSALVINGQEFTEDGIFAAITEIKNVLPEVIDRYKKTFNEDCFKNENIKESEIFKETGTLISAIKLGEKIFKNSISKLCPKTRNYHQILLVLAKNLAINIMDYESYGKSSEKEFVMLLKLFDSVNPETSDTEELKKLIYEAAEKNVRLMLKLRDIQEERYGKQKECEVNYTTFPSKAVLVAGSYISELETVLENLKDTNIDVYTHDEMMIAHTFPKFKDYKNLKGQFGQGLENCLIDFATFPGPIILTRHSLHNIENFYRGRLFTTDNNIPNGVIPIKSNDYAEVIASANSSKGFKKGKTCETIKMGFDYDKAVADIDNRLKTGNIKTVVLIGLDNYYPEQKTYFTKLIKLLSDNVLIISFSYDLNKKNLLHFNTCFDSVALLKIYNHLKNSNLPINIFLPKCDKNTISKMIYFSNQENTRVFVGKCTPVILNPSLMMTLEKDFNIKSISNSANDIELIT